MKNKLFSVFIFLMLIYCLSAVCASEINATSQDLTEIDDSSIKVSSLDTEVSSVDEINENVKLSTTDDSNDKLTSSNEKTDISNINGPKIPGAGIDIHPPKLPNGTKFPKENKIDITGPKAGEHFSFYLGKKSLTEDVVNLNIENSKDLDDLSKYLSNHNPSWGLLNITLKPNTNFEVKNNGFSDYEHSFKFRYWGKMIINGQGSKISGSGNFMYLTQNANLILKNVKISGFDTVFFNFGRIYCYETIFNIKNNVIINYNSVGLESCQFYNDYARGIEAKEGSFNLMYECIFSPLYNEFIKCEKNSIMTIYSYLKINSLNNHVKIDPSACFSIISSFNNKCGVSVIDCNDVNQFKNTLISLNTFTKHAKHVEINLKPGIYELSSEILKI